MSGIVGQNTGRGSGLVKSGVVGADAVDSANIADDAIDSEHYTNASIDNAHLADDAVGLAEMATGTDGNLISYDTSGNPVAVATGSDGQVLTSAGAGAICLFEDAPGGGKIGQVVVNQAMLAGSAIATHSTSFVTTGVVTSITPAATTSKILISVATGGGQIDTATNHWIRTIYRDTTDLGSGDYWFCTHYSPSGLQGPMEHIQWLDSPSTTSEVDYTVFHKTSNAGVTGYWCWDGVYYNMTLMEVLA